MKMSLIISLVAAFIFGLVSFFAVPFATSDGGNVIFYSASALVLGFLFFWFLFLVTKLDRSD
ncbi:MAG: hypothetical protein AAGA72_14085 [Pseudomonadota bacterium]